MGTKARKRLVSLGDELPRVFDVRGRGQLLGIELARAGKSAAPDGAGTNRIVDALLEQGVLVLPSGPHGNVLSLSPALNIPERLFDRALGTLESVLRQELGTKR